MYILLDPDFAVSVALQATHYAPAGAEAEAAADDESGSIDDSASSGGYLRTHWAHILLLIVIYLKQLKYSMLCCTTFSR